MNLEIIIIIIDVVVVFVRAKFLTLKKKVEIDRYIVVPIFFLIFKHFTIIGYRFCKIIVFIYYYLSHT